MPGDWDVGWGRSLVPRPRVECDWLAGCPPSDPDWVETFKVLSVATIKFEMLGTAPQSQVRGVLAQNGSGLAGPRGYWLCPLQLCPAP